MMREFFDDKIESHAEVGCRGDPDRQYIHGGWTRHSCNEPSRSQEEFSEEQETEHERFTMGMLSQCDQTGVGGKRVLLNETALWWHFSGIHVESVLSKEANGCQVRVCDYT